VYLGLSKARIPCCSIHLAIFLECNGSGSTSICNQNDRSASTRFQHDAVHYTVTLARFRGHPSFPRDIRAFVLYCCTGTRDRRIRFVSLAMYRLWNLGLRNLSIQSTQSPSILSIVVVGIFPFRSSKNIFYSFTRYCLCARNDRIVFHRIQTGDASWRHEIRKR